MPNHAFKLDKKYTTRVLSTLLSVFTVGIGLCLLWMIIRPQQRYKEVTIDALKEARFVRLSLYITPCMMRSRSSKMEVADAPFLTPSPKVTRSWARQTGWLGSMQPGWVKTARSEVRGALLEQGIYLSSEQGEPEASDPAFYSGDRPNIDLYMRVRVHEEPGDLLAFYIESNVRYPENLKEYPSFRPSSGDRETTTFLVARKDFSVALRRVVTSEIQGVLQDAKKAEGYVDKAFYEW